MNQNIWAETVWSTIIQVKTDGKWYYFSQQSTKPGETPLSDTEYLKACQRMSLGLILRIAPPRLGVQ